MGQANVVHMFKKRDSPLLNNYRPVGLISVIGKMVKSIITKIIGEHIEEDSSCLTMIYRPSTRECMGIKMGVTIYLDFSKAFDRIPHQSLLIRVNAYGIMDKLWN